MDSRMAEAGALLEQLQHAAMLFVWMIMLIARTIIVLVPQQLPAASGIKRMLTPNVSSDHRVSAASPSLWSSSGAAPSCGIKSPICRALVQVLELMNEIPASSRKYEFTKELAEKMMQENSEGLEQVNKLALEVSFARTVHLLTESLEDVLSQQKAAAWGWVARLLKGLPSPFMPVFSALLGSSASLSASSATDNSNSSNSEASEKYVQELLWMAQMLKQNMATESAIVQWGSLSRLSALSQFATPRVQALLVKLSAFLCVELADREAEAPAELKLNFLLLWTPLFCQASASASGTTMSEKLEVERALDKIIVSLSPTEQEAVLGLWLREFSISSSDWPNLRSCYDKWCHESRGGYEQQQLLLTDKL